MGTSGIEQMRNGEIKRLPCTDAARLFRARLHSLGFRLRRVVALLLYGGGVRRMPIGPV